MSEWELLVDSVWKDFEDDYGFKVKSWPGTGHSPVINRSTDYALQDGALFTGQKMGVRAFTLIGAFYGSATLAAFHDQRQALIKALSSRTTKINTKPATVKLKYTGGTVDKEIDVIYEGGLDLAQFTPTFIENDVPVRFSAYNPQFNATSDTDETLNEPSSLTANYMAVYEDFQWQQPSTGLNNGSEAFIYGQDGLLYAGGLFTTAGGVSTVNVATWNGTTFAAVGTGMNNNITSFAMTPAGLIYAGGNFTTAGGVAANYVASWNGTTWAATAGGPLGTVNDITFNANSGLLYACGAFGAKSWDGTTWANLGSGIGATCRGQASDYNDVNMYVGGDFTTAGGVSANYIARWSGSAWSALGTGLSARAWAVATDSSGNVYAAGEFTTAGGISANRVAKWNGAAWSALGTNSVNNTVRCIFVDDDDNVYIGGSFTNADYPYLAVLGDTDWESPGFEPNAIVTGIYGTGDNLYIGGGFTAGDTIGYTDISYTGSEVAYPVITVTRSGGTSLAIDSILNTRTGAQLFFSYSLLDGETLTIDLRPGLRDVKSSLFGQKWDAVLDTSNLSSFYLQPGNASGANSNVIALSVTETGSATANANLTYRTAYRSLD